VVVMAVVILRRLESDQVVGQLLRKGGKHAKYAALLFEAEF